MFEDIAPNNDNQVEELGKAAENTERKRLAPLTPAITTIDQRIRLLEDKGRKRGKRNSWIGILSSLLILVVVVLVGYFILSEINKIADKVDVEENMANNPVSDPSNLCSENDSCCLTALSRLEKNGYMIIDELGVCPDGFSANKLKCPTSLSWCEPVKKEAVETPVEIDRTSIDVNSWKSYKNPEYGFYFSLPPDLNVVYEDINKGAEIKKIYVKKTATSSEFYLNLKIISSAVGSSSLEEYINEQRSVLVSLASTSGLTADLISRDYKTESLIGKKIIVTTKYESSESVSEEVIFAGNGFLFALSYPNLSSSTATTSLAEITRAIITTFNIANLVQEKSEQLSDQSDDVDKQGLAEEAGKTVDTDKDGLNDDDEKKYNADPNKADTDGDGFSDGDEVKNGYNPGGAGML